MTFSNRMLFDTITVKLGVRPMSATVIPASAAETPIVGVGVLVLAFFILLLLLVVAVRALLVRRRRSAGKGVEEVDLPAESLRELYLSGKLTRSEYEGRVRDLQVAEYLREKGDSK